MDCYLKIVQWLVTPTNHVIALAGFTLCGALGTLKIFATSPPNIDEDQKKSHHLSAWPLAGPMQYYGKSGPSYCITFIKRIMRA